MGLMRTMLAMSLLVGLSVTSAPPVLKAAPVIQFDPSCDGSLYELKDRGELLQFDTELRQALKEKNLLQLSTLVNYPLRVNSEWGGTIEISNPQALKHYFETIFPPALREKILATSPQDVSCMGKGIMYGQGELWVQPVILEAGAFTYRVEAVNLFAAMSQPQDQLSFVCETAYHRILIDTDKDQLRYRAWNKPRALTQDPDLELGAGTRDYQGRGVCGYHIWQFANGTTQYSVSEASLCGEEDVLMRGRLVISDKGKELQTLECR